MISSSQYSFLCSVYVVVANEPLADGNINGMAVVSSSLRITS